MSARAIKTTLAGHAAFTLLLVCASVGVLLLGLFVGSMGWDTQNLSAWWQDDLVWTLRAPRGVGAWLAGALLGLSGALAQALFRNPLADPYLLGSASGASFAYACGLVLSSFAPVSALGLSAWTLSLGLTGLAFAGALLAVLLTLALARGAASSTHLLLSGLMVGVVLGSLTALLATRYPTILPTLQSFTLGSTAYLDGSACSLLALVLWLCCTVAWMHARALDALILGEESAASLGINLIRVRWVLLLVLSLAVAASVAQVGLIAFVGLAASHIVRASVSGATRTSYRGVLLLATCMGGVLLALADVVARGLLAPQELPIGVLTGVLGGVYLLSLMYRGRL